MIADTDIVERLEGQAASRIHSPVHRSLFREAAAALAERDTEIVRLRGEVCSCPSGDGSLRWPCKAHPPESIAPAEAKGDFLSTCGAHQVPDPSCWNCCGKLKTPRKSPQPADGGAVAWAMTDYQSDGPMTVLTSDRAVAEHWASVGVHVEPLYANPQAAQVQGEAVDTLALRMLVAAGHVSQKLMDQSRSIARGVLPGPLDAAHPSACELGSDTARLNWLEANCVDVADEYGTGSQLYLGTYATAPLRTAIDRAIKHRGDSRGGEGR